MEGSTARTTGGGTRSSCLSVATWITLCSSRQVQALGIRTRRHTIGLIPSSHTLTWITPAVSGSGGLASGSTAGSGCFAGRGTAPAYRGRAYLVAGIPHFLIVPLLRTICRGWATSAPARLEGAPRWAALGSAAPPSAGAQRPARVLAFAHAARPLSSFRVCPQHNGRHKRALPTRLGGAWNHIPRQLFPASRGEER